MMTALRWWLFKQISELGWWVCPEPYKTDLVAVWQIGLDEAAYDKEKFETRYVMQERTNVH